ncbi:MAG TPA: hypothetical protein VNL77_07470 [Roseiflexaceae bacterium]|nr:hypothetical protein [Roseiflexaceae bacterium]
MSQTLTISDTLYTQLEQAAHERGFTSIEQLLEAWYAFDAELHRRQQIVQQIDHLRDRLYTRYGEMPDSVELLRQDRDR